VTLPAPSPAHPPRDDIARLVAAFYDHARGDGLLGPVFERAVHDWPHHLASLTTFWTAQLRGTGRYRGIPLAAHRPLTPALSTEMFARWLALWRQTTGEMMSHADAAMLVAKAEDMAERMADALFAKETRE